MWSVQCPRAASYCAIAERGSNALTTMRLARSSRRVTWAARANAAANGVADRVDFRQGDLLAPLDRPVDVVLANLPYLRDDSLEQLVGDRTSLAFEPKLAVTAGKDGLELIWRAATDLSRILGPTGSAFFEVDPPLADQVSALLGHAVGGKPQVICDLAGEARVVFVQIP